jgi:hypothetical protein
MIVRVALVAVFGAMLVAMIVMAMIMPAAAGIAMRVAVGVSLGMAVRVGVIVGVIVGSVIIAMVIVPMMGVIVMAVAAVIVAGMVAIGVVVIIGAALGLERPRHGVHGAALPAHHLGEDMVVLDIDRISGNLGRRMAVADVPGDAHQPQRILGADLKQALRCGLDQDEPAVLQLDGIAVAERGRLVEVEQHVEAAIGLQCEAAAVAVVMVERQRIHDAVLPDGGLANDGNGAKHDETSVTD